MAKQAADDGNGLAMHDGGAGLGVTKFVQPDFHQSRFEPHLLPEAEDNRLRDRSFDLWRRENPAGWPRQHGQHGP